MERAFSEYNAERNENAGKFVEMNIKKSFIVEDYDEVCEEFSKIQEIISIRYSKPKIILFCFLNLFTAFLISLVIVWFPKLKILFLYNQCSIYEAKFVGIFGTGKIR